MAHKVKKTEPATPDHNSRPGQLPALVVGSIEVVRLLKELETIDNALLSHTLRKQGSGANMLKTSRLMDQVVHINQLNLLQKTDRQRLARFLESIRKQAPVLHISFSADPPPSFMEKLVAWLRREIHPQVLVTVGVQPTIAAGCIVRSTNKYFDFSLRQGFTAKRDLLIKQLAPAIKEEMTSNE